MVNKAYIKHIDNITSPFCPFLDGKLWYACTANTNATAPLKPANHITNTTFYLILLFLRNKLIKPVYNINCINLAILIDIIVKITNAPVVFTKSCLNANTANPNNININNSEPCAITCQIWPIILVEFSVSEGFVYNCMNIPQNNTETIPLH